MRSTGDLICWTFLGTEHLFFKDTAGHIHELYKIHDLPFVFNSGWKHNLLTLKAYAPLADHLLQKQEDGKSLNLECIDFLVHTELEEINEFMAEVENSLYPKLEVPDQQELDLKALNEMLSKVIRDHSALQSDLIKLQAGAEVGSTKKELENSLEVLFGTECSEIVTGTEKRNAPNSIQNQRIIEEKYTDSLRTLWKCRAWRY